MMRILIDANVLYPTVLRGLVTGCAARGLFRPRWSARILEECVRAVLRDAPGDATIIRAEIAALQTRFPEAEVTVREDEPAGLWLPDLSDIHVLAAAIEGECEAILTMNTRDFPTRLLARHGIRREEPDMFLLSLPRAEVVEVAEAELEQLRRLSGEDWTMRRMLRKSRLPRLARTLG